MHAIKAALLALCVYVCVNAMVPKLEMKTAEEARVYIVVDSASYRTIQQVDTACQASGFAATATRHR